MIEAIDLDEARKALNLLGLDQGGFIEVDVEKVNAGRHASRDVEEVLAFAKARWRPGSRVHFLPNNGDSCTHWGTIKTEHLGDLGALTRAIDLDPFPGFAFGEEHHAKFLEDVGAFGQLIYDRFGGVLNTTGHGQQLIVPTLTEGGVGKAGCPVNNKNYKQALAILEIVQPLLDRFFVGRVASFKLDRATLKNRQTLRLPGFPHEKTGKLCRVLASDMSKGPIDVSHVEVEVVKESKPRKPGVFSEVPRALLTSGRMAPLRQWFDAVMVDLVNDSAARGRTRFSWPGWLRKLSIDQGTIDQIMGHAGGTRKNAREHDGGARGRFGYTQLVKDVGIERVAQAQQLLNDLQRDVLPDERIPLPAVAAGGKKDKTRLWLAAEDAGDRKVADLADFMLRGCGVHGARGIDREGNEVYRTNMTCKKIGCSYATRVHSRSIEETLTERDDDRNLSVAVTPWREDDARVSDVSCLRYRGFAADGSPLTIYMSYDDRILNEAKERRRVARGAYTLSVPAKKVPAFVANLKVVNLTGLYAGSSDEVLERFQTRPSHLFVKTGDSPFMAPTVPSVRGAFDANKEIAAAAAAEDEGKLPAVMVESLGKGGVVLKRAQYEATWPERQQLQTLATLGLLPEPASIDYVLRHLRLRDYFACG